MESHSSFGLTWHLLCSPLGLGFLLTVLGTPRVLAFDIEPRMTFEQGRRAAAFQLDNLRHLRLRDQRPTPDFVRRYNRLATAAAEAEVLADQQKTGRWFFAFNRAGGANGPEYATVHRYAQMLISYGSLEALPGYSKLNHEQAVRYWQSWQDPVTGRFRNVDDPAAPINGKYMPELLRMLEAAPKHPWMADGGAGLDVDAVTRTCARRPWFSGQFHAATFQHTCMLSAIHEGQAEYLPHLEHGLELLLPLINPTTGMLGGPDDPEGAVWATYGASADTLKGGSRLVGYMGIENLPHRHERADHLLRNVAHFCRGDVAVQRNMLEACVHCITESTCRRDELYDAVRRIAESAMHGSPWDSQASANYITYLFCLAGGMLNWDMYDGRLPLTPQILNNGVLHDWRILIGPYGRVANVYRKADDESFWSPDWSDPRYQQCSYAARNDQHDRRVIHEIVPMTDGNWQFTRDAEGRFVGETTLAVPPGATPLACPFLKMTWDRPVTIALNGKQVAQKLGTMAEAGGVFLPGPLAATVKAGANTVRVHGAAGADAAPRVAVGLIDWRVGPRKVMKLLVMGNSITRHGPNVEDLGWGGDWGMAATAADRDFAHVLRARLAAWQQDPVPELVIENLVARNLPQLQKSGRFADLAAHQADLIVVQTGDNLAPDQAGADSLGDPYEELLRTLRAGNPKALIVAVGTWGINEPRSALIRRAASRQAVPYVDLTALAGDRANFARAEGRFTHDGVNWHPGDAGMTAIADAIWVVVKRHL